MMLRWRYEDAVIDERLDASQEDSPGYTEEIAHYIEQSTILQADRCKSAEQSQDLARLFTCEARYAGAHHVAEPVQDLLPEVGIERQSRGLQGAGRDHRHRDDRHKWAVACCVSEDIDEFLTQCQPRCSGELDHKISRHVKFQRVQLGVKNFSAVEPSLQGRLADSPRCGRPTGREKLSTSRMADVAENSFQARQIALCIFHQYDHRKTAQLTDSAGVQALCAVANHDRPLRLQSDN